MAKTNGITRKQQKVLDDLFADITNEEDILEKHKVSKQLYNDWLSETCFAAEFESRLRNARKQGELLIARYSAHAAAKLIQLTESETQETARKACLDIITLLRPDTVKTNADSPQENADPPAELPPEIASRLLAALATSDK